MRDSRGIGDVCGIATLSQHYEVYRKRKSSSEAAGVSRHPTPRNASSTNPSRKPPEKTGNSRRHQQRTFLENQSYILQVMNMRHA